MKKSLEKAKAKGGQEEEPDDTDDDKQEEDPVKKPTQPIVDKDK